MDEARKRAVAGSGCEGEDKQGVEGTGEGAGARAAWLMSRWRKEGGVVERWRRGLLNGLK